MKTYKKDTEKIELENILESEEGLVCEEQGEKEEETTFSIRKNKKIFLITLGISLIPMFSLIFVYGNLPNEIPIHWNINGEVDNFGSKNMIFILASIPILLAIMLFVIPKIDPKGKNYERFNEFYIMFAVVIVVFMDIVFGITVSEALNPGILDISKILLILVGFLFLIIGNFMPRIKQNYTFGIKVPWTVDNEVVWYKTHRVGGRCFVIAGLLIIISPFLSTPLTVLIFAIAIIIAVVVPIIMSYIFFKQDKGE